MKNLSFEVAEEGANVTVANCGAAMAGDSISKHRRSSTSQKGRGIFFRLLLCLAAAFVIGLSSCNDKEDDKMAAAGKKAGEEYCDCFVEAEADTEGSGEFCGLMLLGYLQELEDESFVNAFLAAVRKCNPNFTFDDNGNGNGNGGGGGGNEVGGGNVGSNQGHLTITGIPAEYNDLYIYVSGSKTPDGVYYIDFAGYEKEVGYVTHFIKISGGEAKIPMWGLNRSNYNYSPYTGNDKDIRIEVEIFNVSSYDWGIMTDRLSEEYLSVRIRERRITGVDFTNGDATIEWGVEPEGFVGGWEGKDEAGWSKIIMFNDDGTWHFDHWGIFYSGTYTSNGKTATMIITQVHHAYDYSQNEGATGVGTIVLNKLTVSGFDGVSSSRNGSLNGEYTYYEN